MVERGINRHRDRYRWEEAAPATGFGNRLSRRRRRLGERGQSVAAPKLQAEPTAAQAQPQRAPDTSGKSQPDPDANAGAASSQGGTTSAAAVTMGCGGGQGDPHSPRLHPPFPLCCSSGNNTGGRGGKHPSPRVGIPLWGRAPAPSVPPSTSQA